MDSDSLLCTRITLCSRNDYLGNYVQKSGYLQHRYRSLYLLALFTMGYQTFLESICRLIKNQTLVDSQHAAIGRCRTGRNRFHHTYVKLLPNDPCHFLASGIQLGYTWYCCRRILHVGTQRTGPGTLCRYPQHFLPHCHNCRPRLAGDARRWTWNMDRQH